MNKYRVYLEGKNFLLSFNGKPEKHGFFTTRFVEANNPEEAENISIGLIRSDTDFKTAVLNKQDDPPMIYLKEIVKLIDFGDIEPPGSGYTFYPESSEE